MYADGAAAGCKLSAQQQLERAQSQWATARNGSCWYCHCHTSLGNDCPWDSWPGNCHRPGARQVPHAVRTCRPMLCVTAVLQLQCAPCALKFSCRERTACLPVSWTDSYPHCALSHSLLAALMRRLLKVYPCRSCLLALAGFAATLCTARSQLQGWSQLRGVFCECRLKSSSGKGHLNWRNRGSRFEFSFDQAACKQLESLAAHRCTVRGAVCKGGCPICGTLLGCGSYHRF